ncbi:MAG TPA: response regulator [Roseateles sp.]|nr:response regulator [Roseateles sp.]
MSLMSISVLVVDDHKLFRRGLIALLAQEPGVQVVGEAADAGEALRLAAQLQPDLVLLDNHMPGATGVASLPALRAAAPRSRILMLTVSEDEQDLSAALRNGAQGYLLKTADGDELAAALSRTMSVESVVSPELTHKLVQALRASGPQPADAPTAQPAPDPGLSPRERDILGLIARGDSNKEIARSLGIAETTVKIHVQHILRKLALSSRVQIAVWASERGLGAAR